MRAMKDSGVPWIGEIPVDWEKRKLFSLLESIGSGTTPKGNDDYYDGEIYWLNTGDLNDGYIFDVKKTVSAIAINECSALSLYPEGSVIIAMYGATIGKLGIIQHEMTTNQACCVMNCGEELDSKYLFYYLFSTRDSIISLAYGAGQPNISQETVRQLRISCPLFDEQKRIANYLDEKCNQIDAAIEKQRKVIEKLGKYKQSLITEAVTKGLDPNVPMKDSGVEWIGEIPEEWQVKKLKYMSVLDISADEVGIQPDEEISFAPMEYIKNGYHLELPKKTLGDVLGKYTYFADGDIVIAKVTPCFENGNLAIAGDLLNNAGFGSSELYVVRAGVVEKKISFLLLVFKEVC